MRAGETPGRRRPRPGPPPAGHGLARLLSKLGYCSRAEAWRLIEAGRVQVDGVVCREPERRMIPGRHSVEVDGRPVRPPARVYLLLNKPRGWVTTASDEKGRTTVFEAFRGGDLPHLSPVGRLDQASEGLLLFTNDTAWAARLTAPACGIDKTYHVQVRGRADPGLCRRLETGLVDAGEHLAVKRAQVLRAGPANLWLEMILDEGRNRHLRRLLAAAGFEVVRLVRVRIGSLVLGNLPKGQWRHLTSAEVAALAGLSDAAAGERPRLA